MPRPLLPLALPCPPARSRPPSRRPPSGATRHSPRPRSSRPRGGRRPTRTPGSGGPVSTEKPADYDAAFRDYYGLHPAPYPNADLPDGLPPRLVPVRQGHRHGLHALPRRVDLRQELRRPGQRLARHPGRLRGHVRRRRPQRQAAVHVQQRPRHVRGRVVRRLPARVPQAGPDVASNGRTSACTTTCARTCPAWWLLKKKKTMYHTGGDRRPVGPVEDAVHDDPGHAAVGLRPGTSRVQGHPRVPADHRGAEVPAADRQANWPRRGEKLFTANCSEVPRHLRREVDVPEQDRPARRDRHRPEAVRGDRGQVRRRRTTSRGSPRRSRTATEVGADQGLPGPAARRHLGDRPVPPQRQRADALPRAQLEGPAEAVHALATGPARPTTTR